MTTATQEIQQKDENQNATQQEIKTIELLIVGTGFGGLGTAIQAKRKGVQDFIVIERATEVGGVWRDNAYPGCACDVQSHLYSFSFAPNPNWSKDFAPQTEIFDYLKYCAKKFHIYPHIHFNTELKSAVWHESLGQWQVETSQGTYHATYVVLGCGSLSDPLIPEIAGQDKFAGLSFHSAQWPKDMDLTGKRVAVIGTGASAIQFIPAIQPMVSNLTVFQRTPAWVLPRHDEKIPDYQKWAFKQSKLLQKLNRQRIYWQREYTALGFKFPILMKQTQYHAKEHIRKAISDPELIKKVTPNYTLGCKRVLISNTYYPALAQPNVEVITTGVKQIRKNDLIAQDGTVHKVDIIIYGSGFKAKELPFADDVRGKSGLTLNQYWEGSPKGFAGTTVHDFPNLFILHGPNVGLGHSSVIYMFEAQIEHIFSVLDLAQQRQANVVEPTAIAQSQYTHWIDKTMKGSVWTSGGCESWYLDHTGRNSSLWPSFTFHFRQKVANAEAKHYHFKRVQKEVAV